MAIGIVKKGSRYFFNPANGALYPWSPDLTNLSGLLLFTAPRDGDFDMGMTLAEAQESAAADVAVEAEREKESALARAEHAIAAEAENLEKGASAEIKKFNAEMRHLAHRDQPTLTVTDTPD